MKAIEYTPEFEAWWATESYKYEHQVGVLTEMFKEVSFRAWSAGYLKGIEDWCQK